MSAETDAARVAALEAWAKSHEAFCVERNTVTTRQLDEIKSGGKKSEGRLRVAIGDSERRALGAVAEVKSDVKGLYSRWWWVAGTVIAALFGAIGLVYMLATWIERASKTLGIGGPF